MEHYAGSASTEQNRFYRNVMIGLLMVLVMWTVKMVEEFLTGSLSDYGLRPGEFSGLIGIVTMPFLHGDFEHLINNSAGIFITTLVALQIYPKSFWRSFGLIYVLGHLLTWLFARDNSVHIGASGVIYGLWGFLLMGAFVRRDRPASGAAMVVVLLFAGMIWGTMPIWVDKSWEGHLFGMLSGFVAAGVFSKMDRVIPEPWPEEVEFEVEDDIEIPPLQGHEPAQPEAKQHDQVIQDPAWRAILDQWEQDIQQERFRNRTPND
jgi:membrane associated rhomboid family serine protease